MTRVDIQFLDQSFHRAMFDAMPVPVFVVDEDVSILEYNSAAGRLLGKNRRLVLGRRGGDVLNCVHSKDVSGGCGCGPACRDCVVRGSVRAAARGRGVTRRWTGMELLTKGKRVKVKVRVSCQRFTCGRQSFILLILEGLNG